MELAVEVDTDEDERINAKSEDGTSTATNANGKVTTAEGSSDDDRADFIVKDEDGHATFTSEEGNPSQQPSDVSEPQGVNEVSGICISNDPDLIVVVNGTAVTDDKDVSENYAGRRSDTELIKETDFDQGDKFFGSIIVKRHLR